MCVFESVHVCVTQSFLPANLPRQSCHASRGGHHRELAEAWSSRKEDAEVEEEEEEEESRVLAEGRGVGGAWPVLTFVHIESDSPDCNPDHALWVVEKLNGLRVQGKIISVLEAWKTESADVNTLARTSCSERGEAAGQDSCYYMGTAASPLQQ